MTSSVQANNTPAPGNAKSTHTIEDGTQNDQSPLTVENPTPNIDYTDALSEASGQQPPGISFGSTPIAVPTYMGCTVLPGAHPGVLLPPVLLRMKDKIISGEVLSQKPLGPLQSN